MTLKDYQYYAVRTMANLGDIKKDLSHMALGLGGELSEIFEAKTLVNKLEEIGDQFWYLSCYCTIRGIAIEDVKNKSERLVQSNFDEELIQNGVFLHLICNVSKLQDIVKKYTVYNKEIDEEKELELLSKIYKNLIDYGYLFNETSLSNVLQKNIDKLRVRYPEKYQDHLAVNRNLDEEYKVLGSDYDYDKTTAYYSK